MALSLTITMKSFNKEEAKPSLALNNDNIPSLNDHPLLTHEKNKFLPSKRVSRLLAQNPNAPLHCHKDAEYCYLNGATNSTCCNNKCIDLSYDKHNCGACKKKCKYAQTCCKGKCVDTNYDKSNCGGCSVHCELGQYCVYGMCDYA